eukprot:Stramenopile-MAST_4_protein_4419
MMRHDNNVQENCEMIYGQILMTLDFFTALRGEGKDRDQVFCVVYIWKHSSTQLLRHWGKTKRWTGKVAMAGKIDVSGGALEMVHNVINPSGLQEGNQHRRVLTSQGAAKLTRFQRCCIFATMENFFIFCLLIGGSIGLYHMSHKYSTYTVHSVAFFILATQLALLQIYFLFKIGKVIWFGAQTQRRRRKGRTNRSNSVRQNCGVISVRVLYNAYMKLFDVNGQYYLIKMYLSEAVENTMQLYNMVAIYLCSMPLSLVAAISSVLLLEIVSSIYHASQMNSQVIRDRQLLVALLSDTFCLTFPLVYVVVFTSVPVDPNEALFMCAVPTACILVKVYDIWADLFAVDMQRTKPKSDSMSRRTRSSTRQSILRLSRNEAVMQKQLSYFPETVRYFFLLYEGILGIVFVTMIVIQLSTNPTFGACAREYGTEIWTGCHFEVAFCANPFIASCDCAIMNLVNYSQPKLPNKFSNIKSLVSLQVITGKIESLPTTFATDHPKLKSFQLIGNRLSALPANIGDMSKLLVLDVGSNQLRELPESLGELNNLVELRLRMNNLTSLPSTLQRMGKLRNLVVNNNRLDRLPPWIGSLASLKSLQVQHNLLRELPSGIGKLGTLTLLFAWNNSLALLPSTMGDMTSMEYFDVRNNRLVDLPISVGSWEYIVHFDVGGNPLCSRDGFSLGKASCADTCAADCPRVFRNDGVCDDSKYFYHYSYSSGSSNFKPHLDEGCNTETCKYDDSDCVI